MIYIALHRSKMILRQFHQVASICTQRLGEAPCDSVKHHATLGHRTLTDVRRERQDASGAIRLGLRVETRSTD